jgi:iron complex outermembrane receptor protein
VWLTGSWPSGDASSIGVAASDAQGTTHTQAVWAQDAWKFHPDLKLTIGGRWENWTASDGYNQSLAGLNALGTGWTFTPANAIADLPIIQPNLHHTRFSPKGSLQWMPDSDWTVTGSIGLANRFPTARELYNLSTLSGATGVTVNPNPNLRPEVALSSEVAVERKIGVDGNVRLSLFNEEVRDAIISQNSYAAGSTVIVSANTNIDKIRNRGVELAFRKDNVLIDRFELQGSVTYVDSRILADAGWAGGSVANNDVWDLSPVGKNVPYVPSVRWTLQGTWRPDDHWSITAAARWQGRMWSTLSNNDFVHGVYGSFDRFFVVDTKINYKLDERATLSFGVDNLNNDKYFLFHPFPQRTFTLAGSYKFGASPRDAGIFRSSEPDAGFWDTVARQFARM